MQQNTMVIWPAVSLLYQLVGGVLLAQASEQLQERRDGQTIHISTTFSTLREITRIYSITTTGAGYTGTEKRLELIEELANATSTYNSTTSMSYNSMTTAKFTKTPNIFASDITQSGVGISVGSGIGGLLLTGAGVFIVRRRRSTRMRRARTNNVGASEEQSPQLQSDLGKNSLNKKSLPRVIISDSLLRRPIAKIRIRIILSEYKVAASSHIEGMKGGSSLRVNASAGSDEGR
ncbi:hypothetical protein K440DRAFT_641246 [Wilcoxina mikolae CBS 423.85]|nr:hypothetical protein K440DRAFT_641246 [Wilcoxina mikolae CBS 423.85]